MKYLNSAIFCLFLCSWLIALGATKAQDETDLSFGALITGELNNNNPRAVYTFSGRRGEVVRLSVRATSGDLDPIMSVFDSRGNILFWRDDANGTRDIDYTLTLESNERYFVVIGRFGHALGSTNGAYELLLERIGVISAAGSTLRYGDSVQNTISNLQPQVYYTFQAQAGDIINIRMERNSGTLDPYLQVVNSEAFVIADNDDAPSAGTNNAAIEGLVIEQSGTYIVIAGRYGQAAGDSVGNFVLTIEEATNSGLGNSTLAPFPIQMNQVIEGELDNTRYERFYTFTARKDDLITIRMERTSGLLDAYLILANAGLQPILEDDDGGNGKNALISQYRLPADGLYYIIATRFEGAQGTTSGGYRLQLESNGNAFENVPSTVTRMEYGTTVTGRLDAATPEALYAFWGRVDDPVTISLNRTDGDLDTVIELLDDEQIRLVRDDDSGGNQNARIERYTLPYTGLYFIRAKRYEGNNGNPNTAGSYILVLARRAD